MKKKLFLIILICYWSYGQENHLPELIPPSPTAYELGKYGQIPIGMFTGTPNVNIPLYTYTSRNIEIPITLNYNSSGIKVDQLASNVGLGWSLQTGGVITRTVKGVPDETRAIDNFEQDYTNIPITGSMVSTDPIINRYLYNSSIIEQDADTQRDIFAFNFQGYQGEFIIGKDGRFLMMPPQPMKIEKIQDSESFGFKLTTVDGVIYTFLDREYTQNLSQTVNGSNGVPDEFPSSWFLSSIIHPKGDSVLFEYEETSTIYDISKSERLTINTDDNESCASQGNPSPVVSGGECPSTGFNTDIFTTSIRGKMLKRIHSGLSEITFSNSMTYPNYKINQIKVKYNNIDIEQIDFQYYLSATDRLFLEHIQFLNPEKKYTLDYINKNNLPSRLSNAQDYWGYYNGKIENSRLTPYIDLGQYMNERIRLNLNMHSYDFANREPSAVTGKNGLLKKIIYPTKGSTSFEYEPNTFYGEVENFQVRQEILEYESGTATLGIQHNFHVTNISSKHEVLFRAEITSDLTACNHIPEDRQLASFTAFNRNIKLTATNPVQTIRIDPTMIEIDSNGNYIIDYAFGITDCYSVKATLDFVERTVAPGNQITGGFRVHKTIDDDGKGNQEYKTYYYHQKNEPLKSSGNVLALDIRPTTIGNTVVCSYQNDFGSPTIAYMQCNAWVIDSDMLTATYFGKGYSYYKEVSVSHGGINYENGGEYFEHYVDPNQRGHLIFFSDLQETASSQTIPIAQTGVSNTNNLNGKLKYHSVFSVVDNHQTILKETIYTYKEDSRIHDSENNYVLKRDLFTDGDNSITRTYEYRCNASEIATSVHPCQYQNPVIMHNFFEYNIAIYKNISQWTYLDKKIEREYSIDGQQSIEKTTEYFYDNPEHMLVSRIRTTEADGNITEVKHSYPDDIDYISSLDGEILSNLDFLAIEELKTQHQKEKLLQTEITQVKENNTILLKRQRTLFKEISGNLILPYVLKTATDQFPLEDIIQYHHYDQEGNIQEVSRKNGTHIVYLWGYDYKYPIAKIENATYAEVMSTLERNSNDNLLYLQDYTNIQLNIELEKIRVGLPNAMVTTLLYRPMIGISTITDSRGEQTTYHYDQFNRLEYVKDSQNNILSKNQYHYKN